MNVCATQGLPSFSLLLKTEIALAKYLCYILNHMQTKLFLVFLLASLSLSQISFGSGGPGQQKAYTSTSTSEYEAKRIVVRLAKGANIQKIEAAIRQLGFSEMRPTFPAHHLRRQDSKAPDLKDFYNLTIAAPYSVHYAVQLAQGVAGVQYGCPRPIYRLSYVPNDTYYAAQQRTYMNKIGAPTAWDTQRGDSTVIIGIVDSGVEITHPDLVGNLARNYADPIDGIDNDMDGLIDNFQGWDFGGASYNTVVGDNDPNITGANNAHGTHVAGIAAARTDNRRGVASVSFNCKFLAVKCAADDDQRSNGSGFIIGGYEGITYSADMGAKIINCSWGGSGFNQFAADVVAYAQSKGALVVCAAGNNDSNQDFYPASFTDVLSVAAMNNNDTKASFSNFNFNVGIGAPGVNIYSTYYGGAYASLSGTSMASPVIAGAAGLIASANPTATAEEIKSILKAGSDNIYNVGVNSGAQFAGRLGSGRLNLTKSLATRSSFVRLSQKVVTDGNDNRFVSGDTIRLGAIFKNLLFATRANAQAVFSTSSSFLNILTANSTQAIGVLAKGDSLDRRNVPISMIVDPSTPINADVVVKIVYTDSVYSYTESITLRLNAAYIDFEANNLASTASSNGRIGYFGFQQDQGQGLSFKGSTSLFYDMALMVGTSGSVVSDAARAGNGADADNDFQYTTRSEERRVGKEC